PTTVSLGFETPTLVHCVVMRVCLWLLAAFACHARAATPCQSAAPLEPADRRSAKQLLRVGTFNTAFLFDGLSDTAAAQSVWANQTEADKHLTKVAEQVQLIPSFSP